jgi:hypothetical protein
VATRGLAQFKQLLHKHGFDSAEYSGATEALQDAADDERGMRQFNGGIGDGRGE